MKIQNILTYIIVATCIISCTTIRYIPVERIQHDSIRIGEIRRDSMILHDSINILTRGDTVYTTKYSYRYRDRIKIDTFTHIQHDTITQTITIEKELSSWQKRKIAIGEWFLWGIPVLLVIIMLKRFRR